MTIEHKKLFSLSVLIGLTVYVYGLTKTIKDTLIVSSMGAEAISVLKLYGTLPLSIMMILAYAKMLKIFNRSTIYHIFNCFFLIFFFIFIYYLQPNVSYLDWEWSPEYTHRLHNDLSFLKYAALAFSHWVYSLFYIITDLWNNIMLSLLFWQLANQIMTVRQAQKNYPIIMLVAQMGLIASGETIQYVAGLYDAMGWHHMLRDIVLIVVVLGVLMSVVFYYITHNIVGFDTINKIEEEVFYTNSIVTNFKTVFTSRYIILIIALITCYSFIGFLAETVWKKMVYMHIPNPIDYGRFMGQMQTYIACTLIMFMLVSLYVTRVVSWRALALITPIFLFIIISAFFIAIIYYEDADQNSVKIFNISIALFIMLIGVLQSICIKSSHAFFDPAREIVFIPLPEPTRSVSKACGMVSMKAGKACASLVQWIMLSFIPGASLLTLAPNIFMIIIIVTIVWILVAIALSQEFNNKLYNK